MDRDDIAERINSAIGDYQESIDRIASHTLAWIVTDLDTPDDDGASFPNARWMVCDESDQNMDGELTFVSLLDEAGVEIELPDEGQRYFEDVYLNNLDDRNRDSWCAFDTPAEPQGRHSTHHRLDLQAIREALAEGLLLTEAVL